MRLSISIVSFKVVTSSLNSRFSCSSWSIFLFWWLARVLYEWDSLTLWTRGKNGSWVFFSKECKCFVNDEWYANDEKILHFQGIFSNIYAVNITITSTETSHFITELERSHEKVQEIKYKIISKSYRSFLMMVQLHTVDFSSVSSTGRFPKLVDRR